MDDCYTDMLAWCCNRDAASAGFNSDGTHIDSSVISCAKRCAVIFLRTIIIRTELALPFLRHEKAE